MATTYSIKLDPSHTGIILTDAETGKELPIGEREGWDLLLGYLRRAAREQAPEPAANLAEAQRQAIWPVGMPVRFAPPANSPWREHPMFKYNPDFVGGKVHSEHKDGRVMVTMDAACGCPGTYPLPAKHLTNSVRKFTAKGSLVLSLEDLGL